MLSPKNLFSIDKKIYFEFETGLNLPDLNQIFPIKSSEFEITLSVKIYD